VSSFRPDTEKNGVSYWLDPLAKRGQLIFSNTSSLRGYVLGIVNCLSPDQELWLKSLLVDLEWSILIGCIKMTEQSHLKRKETITDVSTEKSLLDPS
jgi:hypothetical protein